MIDNDASLLECNHICMKWHEHDETLTHIDACKLMMQCFSNEEYATFEECLMKNA